MRLLSFNGLSSVDFEHFCFELLKHLGATNVDWRKGTDYDSSPADSGRDIECDWLDKERDSLGCVGKCFVSCKHQREGVPPTGLADTLAWATACRPDTVIFMSSGFFSNPAKDYIEIYRSKNKPSFRIILWEYPDLEQLAMGKDDLLSKFSVRKGTAHLSLINPVHAAFMKKNPYCSVKDLLKILEDLDCKQRDNVLCSACLHLVEPHIMKSVTGTETLGELMSEKLDYPTFKAKLLDIASSGRIPEAVLVYYVLCFTLNALLSFGDTTEIGDVIARIESDISIIRSGKGLEHFTAEQKRKSLARFEEMSKTTRERIEGNYELYNYFCMNVVLPVLMKDAFAR